MLFIVLVKHFSSHDLWWRAEHFSVCLLCVAHVSGETHCLLHSVARARADTDTRHSWAVCFPHTDPHLLSSPAYKAGLSISLHDVIQIQLYDKTEFDLLALLII